MRNMKIRTIENKDYGYIVDIYNYYVQNSNAAFIDKSIDIKFVETLHKAALKNSFLVLDKGEMIVGFALLKSFLPIETFNRTATVSYFIAPEYTRQGLGSLLINRLVDYAHTSNIDNFIAEISSDNIQSINFHKKQGFQQCGLLSNVGFKNKDDFSIIYMQKHINCSL